MYNSNTERIIPKMRASPNVRRKLRVKHAVSMQEVYECFANRAGTFLEDARAEHATVPPTMWFVAQTDGGRKQKVVFMENADQSYEIRTAYEPNVEEERIYDKYS
jgi:hypothetical protein